VLKLLIVDEEGRRTVVPFVRKDVTFGRSQTSTIRLSDEAVAMRHARLAKGPTGIMTLYDMANSVSRTVRPGDQFQIGSYTISVLNDEPEEESEQQSEDPPEERRPVPLEESEAKTDPLMQALPGTVEFGRYVLLGKLGRGGMAQAWRATMGGATALTRQVVIKRILPQYAKDPGFVSAFIEEAKVTASLSHGNIAQVLDFGEVNGEFFLAVEYVHGRTLEALLDQVTPHGFQWLPPPVAVFIAAEMLKGLHYAHTRRSETGKPLKIVHRDVSPDNLILGFDGQAKLIDFGVAKSQMEGRVETAPGVVKGKAAYFSPEQAAAEPLDARSDVFAMGTVLYRMLCNKLPFGGPMHVAMLAIARLDYPPPATVNPTLPEALIKIVTHALEGQREDRYPDAATMESDLRAWLARNDPEFNSETLSDFVRWMFEEELVKEGLDLPVPDKSREKFERWRTQPDEAAAEPEPEAPPKKTSGMFERLFGKKK
jgi:serine/threonine-protein kinase